VPLQPVLVDAVDRYPFTSAERARLLIYRRAVQDKAKITFRDTNVSLVPNEEQMKLLREEEITV